MDPSSSSSQQEASGPSNLKTPQMDQNDWTSSASVSTPTSGTPSRQSFPRRLSLLQSDSTASPTRTGTSSNDESSRRISFTGPKPLSLGSQPIASAPSTASSSSTAETPRSNKRSSISYIPSPSTNAKFEDVQLSRAPSTSSASGRTRTGSISRATAAGSVGSTRRRPSQTSQGGAISDADDWLMNENDASSSLAAKSMAERDSAKVEALFNDTGYREGITAGKLSTLQSGFDQGFNEVGAILGRQVGLLRGQVAALLLLTSSFSSSPTSTPSSAAAGVRKAAARSRGPAATASLPLLAHPGLEQAKVELRRLATDLDAITLDKLAEPDYEAIEHEGQHQDGEAIAVNRETQEEKLQREQILSGLQQRLQTIRQMVGLKPLEA